MASHKKEIDIIDAELRIAEWAYSDPKHMRELEKNPKKVLEKTLGTKLPSCMKVDLKKNTKKTFHVNIPESNEQILKELFAAGMVTDKALNASALEKVGGGISFGAIFSGVRKVVNTSSRITEGISLESRGRRRRGGGSRSRRR